MSNFLIPGGLYRIYYRRYSKKKEPKPTSSYKALVISVNFGGVHVFTEQDLKDKKFSKTNHAYEAVEMSKHCAPERFAINPKEVARAHLLKIMKDMREWPMEAVRTYFARRGVSRAHLDMLYSKPDRVVTQRDIDFGRYHVRAALRTRRKQEKLKKKLSKKRGNDIIEATFTGEDDSGYLCFSLAVYDLEPVRYRFGRNSGIEIVRYLEHSNIVYCYDIDGNIVHKMSTEWPSEVVRESKERWRQRKQSTKREWVATAGATWSGYYTTSGTTS